MDKPGSSSSSIISISSSSSSSSCGTSSGSSIGTSETPLEPEKATLLAAPHDPAITREQLQEFAKEIDPNAQLDTDVEDCLLNYAEGFMESIVKGSCELASHRKSSKLEEKDVQAYLDRNWNLWTPGFGRDEVKACERAPASHAHKQRLALIKRTTKSKKK